MAAYVIDPGCSWVDLEAGCQSLVQQVHVARSQCIPQERHYQGVIRKLTFVRRDVLDHFIWMNDGFGFEQHRRCYDAGEGIETLQNHVGFRQVFAIRTELFPNKCHSIEPKDFHALIRQEEQFLSHVVENIRVAIVQVPLIGVKGRPNPGFQALKPGEGAGMFIRENLADILLVSIRNGAVGVNSIHFLIVRIASDGTLSPFMLVRGVIDN